jgi:cytochrome c553
MVQASSTRMPSFPWLIACLALILLAVASTVRSRSELPLLSAVDAAAVIDEAARSQDPPFVTTIRRPSGPPVIELQHADPQGRVGSVACSTCHSVRPPNMANRKPADLDQFHQNMPMAHGELACYSCHNPTDSDSLHLADSTPLDYSDVMTLCAQCHGSQAKDYAHGAHGGMNGYWDLSRGPRTRNNCIDCHDPHVPKFPTMQPTFKPRDRFLDPPAAHAGDAGNQFIHSEADGE